MSSVDRPSTGVPKSVAASAMPSPTSGTTRSVSACVSRGSDTSPDRLTNAEGPLISNRSVTMMPRATLTSPSMLSKAKPSLKTSRKSNIARRGSDCSESSPRSLPAPGSSLANCPRSAFTCRVPERIAVEKSCGKPGHASVPSRWPAPRLM